MKLSVLVCISLLVLCNKVSQTGCLSPGVRKSKVKVLAGLVSSDVVRENWFQASPRVSGGLLAIVGVPWLGETQPIPSLCVHTAFSLCVAPCHNFSFL